ncbi:MAG TPA: alpha/beta hydrolase [Blastocatellia bacterium]|nr:alpha/beta hydrolase [Blastocatellia bacterium]
MKVRIAGLLGLLSLVVSTAQAQKVISLYPGAAPGSENWTHQEREYVSPTARIPLVTNVVRPTLTVYAPDPASANGTSVIVCPGGAFHFLAISHEGTEVAKWLTSRGITAFVLRYRLVPTGEDAAKELREKMKDQKKFDDDNAPYMKMAIADGAAAVSYVRKHAGELGVSPSRIGLMGFSAGGYVAAGVALSFTPETRPDFVAPIYAFVGDLKDKTAASDAPPMFIAAATDDGLVPGSVQLYNQWLATKKPVEIHLYAKGGHGFGMRKQNLPTDQWIERLGDWLKMHGLLTK